MTPTNQVPIGDDNLDLQSTKGPADQPTHSLTRTHPLPHFPTVTYLFMDALQVLPDHKGRDGARVVPAGVPLQAARHAAPAGRRQAHRPHVRLLRLLRLGRGAELKLLTPDHKQLLLLE